MNNLHDKFVKERLSEKQNAIDFLKLSVPKNILALINLETLIPTQNSFISEDLKELLTDIIYNCELVNGKQGSCTILIEHKSYRDPLVSFQLLSYLSAGYLHQIKNKEPRRVIIPLLFSHHKGNWEYRSIDSYFADFPDDLQRFIPKFDVIPYDVNKQSDETILSIRNIAISTMIITQKHYQNPYDLLDKMGKIYESLQTQEERNSFNKNFVYIMLLSKKDGNIIELIQKNKDKPINQIFMSLYEEITLKNRLEGKAEGKVEGKIEVIVNGFDQGVAISLLANITSMTENQIIAILKQHGRLS